MALALSVADGETFNVGFRKFRVVGRSTEQVLLLHELGTATHVVSRSLFANISKDIGIREGMRSTSSNYRIDIEAPKEMHIWRGEFDHSAPVATLAPVPLTYF